MITSHGPQLRRLRIGMALSQRSVAKATGFSQATISLIESGKKAAPEAYLVALGRLCGVVLVEPKRLQIVRRNPPRRWRDLPPTELARAFRERRPYCG